MADSDDESFSPEEFSGRVRLFPLPNLVVFPHVMQPLRIFEPRYRAMLEDALAGDGLIAMALLAPGWEKNYEGRPAIESIACLCRVATYHKTDDGSYNVLLLGLKRIEVVSELPPEKLYREAEVRVCEDEDCSDNDTSLAGLQKRLLLSFKQFLPRLPEPQEQLEHILERKVPLPMLTDIVSYMLEVDLRMKIRLLAECNVRRRCELLLEFLSALLSAKSDARSRGKFPPDFSPN